MGVTGLTRGGMMYQKLLFVARGIAKRETLDPDATTAMAELITVTCGGSVADIEGTKADIEDGIYRDSAK